MRPRPAAPARGSPSNSDGSDTIVRASAGERGADRQIRPRSGLRSSWHRRCSFPADRRVLVFLPHHPTGAFQRAAELAASDLGWAEPSAPAQPSSASLADGCRRRRARHDSESNVRGHGLRRRRRSVAAVPGLGRPRTLPDMCEHERSPGPFVEPDGPRASHADLHRRRHAARHGSLPQRPASRVRSVRRGVAGPTRDRRRGVSYVVDPIA